MNLRDGLAACDLYKVEVTFSLSYFFATPSADGTSRSLHTDLTEASGCCHGRSALHTCLNSHNLYCLVKLTVESAKNGWVASSLASVLHIC
jgi:hypothetical protein